MSAPINKQLAGGYELSESLGSLNEFWGSIEKDTGPMINGEGETLKADGGGMYASFEEPKNDTNSLGEEIEEEGNPEAELEAWLNDADNSLVESDKSKESVEAAETSVDIESNSYIPVIEQYWKIWIISSEQVNLIIDNISNGLNLPEILEVWIDEKQKELLDGTLQSIDAEKIEENQANFLEDYKDFANKPIDLENDRVFANISEHYTRIGDGTNQSKEANFSLSVQLAKAKILQDAPSINRDTVWFEKAIININSENHKQEYQWIKFLLEEWTNEAWKGKNMDKASMKKSKDTQVANNNAAEEFQRSQSEKARIAAENKDINDIALEASNLNQAPEETGWDVFGTVWELDTANASV